MGNLRASYTKDNGVLKIVQLSDYDAFGYEHYRNTIFSGNTPQQYRYQNQLKIDDFDIGWDMFKFRASDNQIGRFFRVDPMADKREWLSPYNYAQNNPINRIDPDGALDEPLPGEIGMMIGAAVIGVKHSIMNLLYNAGDGLGITPAGAGMKWQASQAFSEGENRYVSVMNKVPMEGIIKDTGGHLLDGLNAMAGVSPASGTTTGLLAKTAPSATIVNEVVQTAKEGLAGAKAAQKSVVKGTAPGGVNRIDIPKLDPNGKPLHGQQSHAHVTVGKQKAAVNQDGSYKHGDASLTQKIKTFLTDHGWKF